MFSKKEIKKIRLNFPILKKKILGQRIIYFDNSSTTQKPKFLIRSINNYYLNYNSNINRINYYLSNKTNLLIEKTRIYLKKFINAKFSSEIIFTKGTTESINLISKSLNFKKNDEIVITGLEHHSNILPWQLLRIEKNIRLRVVRINSQYNISLSTLSNYINKNTKIVSITHISNVFGTILPIESIVKYIRSYNPNILILLDSAQSIAHIPIDVQKLDIDFLVFSAHKIYGPTGLGILYGKKEILKSMNKYQVGGNMVKDVKIKRTLYLSIPNKFEAGTPNISSIISFYSVLKYIRYLNINRIYSYEKSLLEYTKKLFLKNNKIISYTSKNLNTTSIFSFNIKKINNFDIGCLLNNYAIFVRTGYQCSQPLFQMLKIKNGCVRISYGVYNNKEEIKKVYNSILKIIKEYS
ncbi:MAG: aminotransferase class V-fold PLP-dependent enzyme [Candidatus Shikimatogenerans bostrichidophilus]|nr:MAG: aminotransferase class V-fold PLP-dependent enzyme [Candidatus Shikimatogenerans bostrichidophilus]